jgi:hypothetical protein
MAVTFFFIMLWVAVAQVANVVGWPVDRGGGLYVSGILSLLVLSALQFILLVLDSSTGGRLASAD